MGGTLRGITLQDKGIQRKGIKMEEDGVICQEAKDPSTCGHIYPQRSKGSGHNVGLNMIKEARQIEEQNAPNLICSNSVLCLKT